MLKKRRFVRAAGEVQPSDRPLGQPHIGWHHLCNGAIRKWFYSTEVDYCRSCIYVCNHRLQETEFCRESATAGAAASSVEVMAAFSPLSCKSMSMYSRIPSWKRRKSTVVWDTDKQAELLLFLLTSLIISEGTNKLGFKLWIKLESHVLNYRKIVIIHFDSIWEPWKRNVSHIHAAGT